MPTGKRPTEEIVDYMGKVTLVPNLSYLFSAGTGPLLQLENKAKLKPITWLSQNTIWLANFTKH